jgi:hypothetical protein
MAQVTMSGSIAFGFAGDTTSSGLSTRGFGTDTAALKVATSEDLGGGLKLSASMSFENFQEDETLKGTGTNLTLSGGFGSVTMNSDESGDYLPIDGLTTNGNGTIADRVTYTAPSMNGVTLSVTHGDDNGVIDADASSVNGKATSVSVSYAAGPFTANVTSLSVGGVGQTSTGITGRTYYKAGYDAGFAAVTYGSIKTKSTTNNTQTGLTVSAPVAGFTLSASKATSKDVGGTKYNGTAFGASYALSKRTSIAYYNEAFETSVTTSKLKEYSLLLKHSF